MKPFHVAAIIAQAALAAANQSMGDAEVRPASDAILGGKPAPADGVQVISQQCNLGECFAIFKTVHAGKDELPSLIKSLEGAVKGCKPAFEDCTKQLEAYIQKVKTDRGIPG
ncbi:hypothetical protein NLG97_g2232 [Lecanicillium saksenae]|uniref:Uncharacterized protein n=1 Tax=Lecanicillium saksenae TaxID=468837 RepID=A0ACC1R3D8_9HYPO|nr:hypothetical protein NLG97_g2232 [Lecanicillium saksenae]